MRWIAPISVIACVAAVTASGASTSLPRLAFSDPSWSHRGNRIALAGRRPSGQYALFVMNANGTRMRQIGGYTAFLHWPTWSPDDRWIAYSTGNGGIWKVAAAGGKPTRVTRFGWMPAWSPTGQTIAFAWGGETQGSRIYVVRSDGSRLHLVARSSAYRSYRGPSWSPLGLRLVFAVTTAPDAASRPGLLAVIPSRGGRLTTVLAREDPDQPSWSPRGRYVAFAARRGTIVSTLDLGTGAVRHLRAGRSPTWSPNGRRIAYERAGVIYSMNRDGTGVRRLTPCRVLDCR